MDGLLPTVSVIVPFRNDTRRLHQCLRALTHQDYPSRLIQILAVDNGSTASLQPLKSQFPRVNWLSQPIPGSYAARNQALGYATGEVLAFTDADCIPSSIWLTQGVSAVRNWSHNAIIAGNIEFFCARRKCNLYELYDMLFGLQQEKYATRDGFGVTANLFVPAELMQLVGPFNPNLRSKGDFEWCDRAARHGYRTRFSPSATVYHPARSSFSALLKKTRRVSQGVKDYHTIAAPRATNPPNTKHLLIASGKQLPKVLYYIFSHPRLETPVQRLLVLLVAATLHFFQLLVYIRK